MVNARRAARELALKVLFQIDVGKQPQGEVMQGALSQIQHAVDHPVSQVLHELTTETKAIIESHRPEFSIQSMRQVRNVARSLQAEMSALLESVSRHNAKMIAEPQQMPPDFARTQVEHEVVASVERMQRATDRETLQPDVVKTMVDDAKRRAGQVPAVFGRNAAQAHSTAAFLHQLVTGVLDRQREIDEKVAGLSEGWALDRQPAVDRNILRIAAYEIIYLDDVPAGASINEAVELAKKYSTAESGRFVNGVLGALAAAVGKDQKVGAEHHLDAASGGG